MRTIVLGAGGARRTETSILRALRAIGHPARLVDVPAWTRRLGPLGPSIVRRLVEGFRPDAVILTRHAIRLGEETVRALTAGRAGGFWYFDLAAPSSSDAVLALARAVGTMFVTCHSQIELYRAAGVPHVHYLPQAVDPEVDHPAPHAPPAYRCDISFVGSGQYPYRHELLRRLAEVGSLQIRGPGWDGADGLPVVGGPVHGATFAEVVRGAAISLGAHATREQDEQCACASNRMWKVLGCGGFYLGPWQRGLESFARGGEHCAWYRTVDEAVELSRHYLARPDERAAIAAAGREHALRHHTYAQRVELLLAGRDYPLEVSHTTSS